MKRSNIINMVAVGLIAVAGLRLLLFFNPRPPAVDPRPHSGLGARIATEAVNLLESDARLIVIAREVTEYSVAASAAQLEGFFGTVKKSGKAVPTVRQVKVDPLRAMAVPAGEFFDVLRQAKENDVIVSFLGPPALSADQIAKLGAKRPKVLAVCPGSMPARVDLKRLFDQKLLTLAIVSRPDAPAVASPGEPSRAFEQLFKVIKVDNLEDLQSLAASGPKENGQ